ncbi:MAG: hypothetical protein AAF674_12230 [Pseudomonadota bacterium]
MESLPNHEPGASLSGQTAAADELLEPEAIAPSGFAEAEEAFVGASHGGLPPLLDAQEGRISRVVMAVPRRAAVHRALPLRRVLTALPHRAAIDILVAPEATDAVSKWVDQTGPGALACLIQARTGLGFPLWVQDIVLGRDLGILSALGDPEEETIPEAVSTLADGAEVQVNQLNARVAGGNVLACGNRLLIGADSLRDSGMDLPTLAAAIDPWRKPLLLGAQRPLPIEEAHPTDTPAEGWTETIHWRCIEGSRQPMPRLDLFVTPAGRDARARARFLVGCPRRGAEALGQECLPHALADAFDEIAEQLHREGANVVRNPLPLVWKDDPQRKRRTWFHLPTNNVIIDDGGKEGRTVLLPCFADESWPSLAEIDSMNAAIWAWMGYSVVRIPYMLSLAEGFGGPRRIVQVIARD